MLHEHQEILDRLYPTKDVGGLLVKALATPDGTKWCVVFDDRVEARLAAEAAAAALKAEKRRG